MKWRNLGLVFDPRGKLDWAATHALQPTPLLLDDRIRIFAGFRDSRGVSRVGFVDVDKRDPRKVIGFSPRPVLDIGEDGCFDENGVVPSAVVSLGTTTLLYYAGYQLGAKVRFSVLGGLAQSVDGGLTFVRHQRVPVFERNDEETLFRVPHTIWHHDDVWKAWYGGGDRFITGESKTYPVYDVRYVESDTPYSFPRAGEAVLTIREDEYRVGRPYVTRREDGRHYMFYGFSTVRDAYRLGFAVSDDGRFWQRRDEDFQLETSAAGWDSEMTAYPAVVQIGTRVLMFFNGRNYGEEGFGVAELVEW